MAMIWRIGFKPSESFRKEMIASRKVQSSNTLPTDEPLRDGDDSRWEFHR
jgi:hypothetical protein